MGVAAAALFTAVYLLLAPPARRWTAEVVVAPILGAVSSRVDVTPRPSPPSVAVEAGGEPVVVYSVPLGILFFLPALLLVALAPDRPWWLVHAAVLLVLGALDLAVVAAGLRWGGGWLTLHAFIDGYVIRPASIAVPLLLLHRGRAASVDPAPRS
jgi:hypothetical protein